MARAKPNRNAPKPPSLKDESLQDDETGTLPLADAVERIEKKRKASSAKKISKLIEDHPDEAVTVLRGWLHQTQ